MLCPCLFKAQGKRFEANMDRIFEHPVFDSAREKVKRVIRQLEKPQEDIFYHKTGQVC